MEIGPIDHDQRLKVAIKEFFPDFLRAFFPYWHRYLNASQAIWLDKEIFHHPPDGSQGLLDLVARSPLRDCDPDNPQYHLFHIEVESGDSVGRVRPRMFEYWDHIAKSHKLPVVSVAIYLGVALEGSGRDKYQAAIPRGNRFRFDWPYIGLPGLEAKRYIRMKSNVFAAALTAFMRIAENEKAKHLADLLQKFARSSENDYRKYLLTELAQTYLILNEDQSAQFQDLMATSHYREASAMSLTFFERGIQQGIQQGMEEGQLAISRKIALKHIEKRFGLNAQLRRHVETMTLDQLLKLIDGLFDPAKSLADLGLTALNGSSAHNGTAR